MPLQILQRRAFNAVQAGATLPATVGVPAGTTLTDLATLTVSANGQIVENKRFTGGSNGGVVVPAGVSGVVIRNCKFVGSGQSRGINTLNASSVVTIQDCTFDGDFADEQLVGKNFSATRCEFLNFSNDAVKMGDNTSLTDSWIHAAHPLTGAHADGIQGIDTPYGVTVTNCLIDIGVDGTGGATPNSAVIITPWTDVKPGPYNITFDHVTFGGGGFTFHVDLGNTDGITVRSCKFLSNVIYGRLQNLDGATPIPSPAVWTGNVDQNGQPLAWTATG